MDRDVCACFRAGKMVMILAFLPLFLQSCFTGSRKGELICAEANPEKGFNIHEQVLMTGFSASGSFVNRFTAIHPGKVMAVAAGGVNGLLILPVDTLQGIPLGFPLGTADFDVLFGYTFDSCQFARTPQFYYMGDHDTNDAVPYDDGYDLSERQVVFELLGEEMQPARWNNCIAIYREKNIKAQLKTYQGSGHEITNEIREDVLNFFREQLQPCLLKVVEKQLPVE